MSAQQSRPVDVNANDVVAFVVEMLVLVLLGVAGWRASGADVLGLLLAVGLPLVAAVLWGAFAAPRARVQSEPMRLITKLLVLGGGVVAGFVVLPTVWGVAFAVVVLVNTTLMYVGPFARRGVS